MDVGSNRISTYVNRRFDWEDPSQEPDAQTTRPWATVLDSAGWTASNADLLQKPYTGDVTNVSKRSAVNAVNGVATAATSVPANLSRFRPGASALTASALVPNSNMVWYGGTYSGTVPETVSFTLTFGGIIGEATPGQQIRKA